MRFAASIRGAIGIASGAAAAMALIPGAAAAQSAAAATERIDNDIYYLAADAREGRGVGTAGLDSAAHFLAGRFAQIGLEPAGGDGYFQAFEIDPTAPGAAHTNLGGTAVMNVVGAIPGRGALAGQVVVLGAHFDHLGYGGFGSLDPDSNGVIHNGADDNGSGTAALIESARLLVNRSATSHRTILFVAFTAEEMGLIGSQHYASHPVRPGDSTYAMINFDMVGRLRADSLIVIGVGSATEWQELIEASNGRYGLGLNWQPDPWGRSDHSSFYAQQIPVVHLFTNVHEDYHRTTDDWHKINTEGIAKIAALAADLAWNLAQRPEPLTFQDVPPPPPPTAQAGRRASLGTIPDMTESPGGVRLTGVRSDSPAEQAGLQSGDIITQIGEHEVPDLMGLQRALMALKAGDTVTIVFMRDGERMEATATLQ
jgi:Zn-dependent M28 family amino/carboxypeptidase